MRSFKKILPVLVYVLFLFLITEGSCQLALRIVTGKWLWETETYCYQTLFKRHPWLVAAPRPNSECGNGDVGFSFNSLGFRGKEVSLSRPEGKRRIICYGGSSTFCTQVSDDETWTHYLEEALGATGNEVLNTGFPGYSTAEIIIQTALQQFDLSPDVCVYYLGWNDIRSSNIENLKSDYSGFHGPSQINNLRLDGLLIHSRLATAQLIRHLSALSKTISKLPSQDTSSEIDERALDIYRSNLKTLIAICKARGVKIVMVPQVLNYSRLTSDKPYNWAPLIKEKDVKKFMEAYNKALIEVSIQENVMCAKEVLTEKWVEEDFVDEGHFSAQGNKKFASLIAKRL